jgi:hypothetical protein
MNMTSQISSPGSPTPVTRHTNMTQKEEELAAAEVGRLVIHHAFSDIV